MSGLKVIKRTPDLGIKIRLQPVVEPVEPVGPVGCPCEATGVEWADMPYWYEYDDGSGGFFLPGELSPIEDNPGRISHFQYEDYGEGIVHRFVGVPIGPKTAGLRWELEWLAPATLGVSAVSSGPVVIVTVPRYPLGSDLTDSSIVRASAYCGDVLVGVLELEIRRGG